MSSALDLVEAASRQPTRPRVSTDAARQPAAGSERLLGITGRHLKLLTAPCRDNLAHPARGLSLFDELLDTLSGFEIRTSGDSAWHAAANRMGLTHDLLATHVGPRGQIRSPDAALLRDPRIVDAAVVRVLRAIVRPDHAGAQLLEHPSGSGALIQTASTIPRAANLRRSADRIQSLIDAFCSNVPSCDVVDVLADLDAVVPAATAVTESELQVDDAAEALRMLRQMSFQQVTGDVHASTGCLLDLCRLATTVCDVTARRLPISPLAGSHSPVAHDEVQGAMLAWRDAAAQVGQHMLSLTKAPRVYREAIQVLRRSSSTGTRAGTIVLRALPQLAAEASYTIMSLTTTGSLVTATKAPCKFEATWRPVETHEGESMAGYFFRAGDATLRASEAVTPLLDQALKLERPAIPARRPDLAELPGDRRAAVHR